MADVLRGVQMVRGSPVTGDPNPSADGAPAGSGSFTLPGLLSPRDPQYDDDTRRFDERMRRLRNIPAFPPFELPPMPRR